MATPSTAPRLAFSSFWVGLKGPGRQWGWGAHLLGPPRNGQDPQQTHAPSSTLASQCRFMNLSGSDAHRRKAEDFSGKQRSTMERILDSKFKQGTWAQCQSCHFTFCSVANVLAHKCARGGHIYTLSSPGVCKLQPTCQIEPTTCELEWWYMFK